MSSATVADEGLPGSTRDASPGVDPRLARAAQTVVMFVVFSALLAITWTRLAIERAPSEEILRMVGLAAIPVVAVLLVRGRWAPILWLVALVAAGFVALSEAFALTLADAWSADREGAFFTPLGESFETGLRGYYDTRVTFDPIAHPEMESIVLLAVFGFAAISGVLAAAGHVASAGVVFLIGVGWPATLRATVGGNSLAIGALILAALLVVLFVVQRRRGTVAGAA